MKTKILIWGLGDRTAKFMERGYFDHCTVTVIVDTYSAVGSYKGHRVIRPSDVACHIQKADYIVVCNQFYSEIIGQMIELGIPLAKVIITDNVTDAFYLPFYERAKDILPEVYEVTKNRIIKSVKLNERDYSDDQTIFKDKRFDNPEYYQDYFRYRTFEFVCEEIAQADIQGAVAELGVFRGTFSALINKKFPDRKLYLFDTFEGFDEREAESEKNSGRCNESFIRSHKDTSVEIMLRSLPYPEQAIVCKGFFPESLTEDASRESFAFVSLDVDFEESTYHGLEFFYPRMSEGGYIFLHDYNTFFLGGVKAAVQRYEKAMGIRLKKIPLADRAGTLVIVK